MSRFKILSNVPEVDISTHLMIFRGGLVNFEDEILEGYVLKSRVLMAQETVGVCHG